MVQLADTSPLKYSPWYSQCIPPDANNGNGGGGSGNYVPDAPIVTNTMQTVITLRSGPTPALVTTYVTYLTPSHTATVPVTAGANNGRSGWVPDTPLSQFPKRSESEEEEEEGGESIDNNSNEKQLPERRGAAAGQQNVAGRQGQAPEPRRLARVQGRGPLH